MQEQNLVISDPTGYIGLTELKIIGTNILKQVKSYNYN